MINFVIVPVLGVRTENLWLGSGVRRGVSGTVVRRHRPGQWATDVEATEYQGLTTALTFYVEEWLCRLTALVWWTTSVRGSKMIPHSSNCVVKETGPLEVSMGAPVGQLSNVISTSAQNVVVVTTMNRATAAKNVTVGLFIILLLKESCNISTSARRGGFVFLHSNVG